MIFTGNILTKTLSKWPKPTPKPWRAGSMHDKFYKYLLGVNIKTRRGTLSPVSCMFQTWIRPEAGDRAGIQSTITIKYYKKSSDHR